MKAKCRYRKTGRRTWSVQVAFIVPVHKHAKHHVPLSKLLLISLLSSVNPTATSSLTLQNLRLRSVRLTRTLECSSVQKVENNTIRHLLTVLVGRVWGAEVAQMEALNDSLLIVFRRAEDEVTYVVYFDPPAFPELKRN
jgi:hypothetical protein